MDRQQPKAEDLVARNQVTDIAAREVAAAVAVATLFHRALVVNPFRRLDCDVALAGDGRAVTGNARRDDTVKHVDATRHALGHLVHDPQAHHIARLVLRQIRNGGVDRLIHERLGLADRDPAHGIAVEADLHELLRAVPPDVVVDAALHDAEDELAVGVRLVLRGLRPAERLLDGLHRARAITGIRKAFVKDHRDVAAENALHLHRLFRTEKKLMSIKMRVEAAPLFRDFSHLS